MQITQNPDFVPIDVFCIVHQLQYITLAVVKNIVPKLIDNYI